MPELPEVETIARGLDKRIAGDTIESVWLGEKPEPLKSSPAEIVAVLERSRIVQVRRVGKHIVFDLEKSGTQVSTRTVQVWKPQVAKTQVSKTQVAKTRTHVAKSASPFGKLGAGDGAPGDGAPNRVAPVSTPGGPGLVGSVTGDHAQWIVHLGMTGQLLIASPESELLKHTHAVLRLASGRELRFVDPRRFGRLAVAHLDLQNGSGFAAPGDEPLEAEIDRFIELFRDRKSPIKSALLNQKLLSGVGNIYADEALFRAGVQPRRRASSLTRDELKKLHRGLKDVLRQAIKLGGSSVSDYVDAEGREGFFQLKHRVYARETKPCLVCRTPIKRVIIAGRSSHYCPHCQK